MTTFLQEPCCFRAYEHSPVILVDELFQNLFLDWRQPFSLLHGVESPKLGFGVVREAISGSLPQLLVGQELKIRNHPGQIRRQLLFRSDRGHRVQKLRFQNPVCLLSPVSKKIVQWCW